MFVQEQNGVNATPSPAPSVQLPPAQHLHEAEQEPHSEVETPRGAMAGRVARSTGGCPCWMSKRDWPSCPNLQNPRGLGCSGPVSCCFPSPPAYRQLPGGTQVPLFLPPTPRSTHLLGPALQQPPPHTSVPPGRQSSVGSEPCTHSHAVTGLLQARAGPFLWPTRFPFLTGLWT